MYQLKNGSEFSVKIYGKLVKSYPCLSIDGSSPLKKSKLTKKPFKPKKKSNKSPRRQKFQGEDNHGYQPQPQNISILMQNQFIQFPQF